MIHSLSVRFYPNEDKAKGKKMPIYLRVTIDRKKAEMATIYSLELKEWDDSKQRSKKDADINDYLTSLESEIYAIARRLEKEKKPLTASTIKNYISRKDKLDVFLLEYYDNHITRLDKAGEVSRDTVQRHKDTKEYVEKFLKEKRLSDILVESFTYKYISDFDSFLINTKINHGPETLQRNTVNAHHSRLRTILIRAMKEGYIVKNPYLDFTLKDTPSQRTFLTEAELKKISTHKLGGNESLMRVRDIFIFSVYTGLRFEDAQQLTIDRIVKNKKRKYSLQLQQEKTSEPVLVPLLTPAWEIIRKYEDSPERKILKKVLPKISNQKFNVYLKVIAGLAGIKKNLTHHVARHTCATTVLLSNEIPIEVVSKWLGHTNIKTTQIYAKTTNTYLEKMAEKVEKKIPV